VEERIRGLERGADDYVTKPFSPQEVVLRVAAVLGRHVCGRETGVQSFALGRLTTDAHRHEARLGASVVELTPTKWGVLSTLARRPGRVYSRIELVNQVRAYEFAGYERTIDSHIKNLRRNLRDDSSEIIETVFGCRNYPRCLRRDSPGTLGRYPGRSCICCSPRSRRACNCLGNGRRLEGGWKAADLTRADAAAADAGARLLVRDAQNGIVKSPDKTGFGSLGPGPGQGPGTLRNGAVVVTRDVVVNGSVVGTVRLGFGGTGTSAVRDIAWTWIILAAAVAVVVALIASWFVTRRITDPLVRLSSTARAFAAGDRSARSAREDVAALGEFGDLARAFNGTAEKVEQSERARQRMSADLAHELRTPLAVLQAGLEELRDGLVEPDQPKLIVLHEQSLRMGRVVQDLAELSAAETAGLSLRRSALDLGQLANDSVAAARSTLAAAGIRSCDENRPCDLTSVFDRLWRGPADTKTVGSGIGLAVVRELVTAHRGTLGATSDGEHDTTITVLIPLLGQPSREPNLVRVQY
jgi:two-component system sensor histidine kinase BaeS